MDERLERRKNVNRGYRKLRTWQMAIELYAFLCEKVKEIPGSPYRLVAQILDAGSSMHLLGKSILGATHATAQDSFRKPRLMLLMNSTIQWKTRYCVKLSRFRRSNERVNGMITSFSAKTNSLTF